MMHRNISSNLKKSDKNILTSNLKFEVVGKALDPVKLKARSGLEDEEHTQEIALWSLI
jgi:hypothetical protein